jgi:hypothetical protein
METVTHVENVAIPSGKVKNPNVNIFF